MLKILKEFLLKIFCIHFKHEANVAVTYRIRNTESAIKIKKIG